MFQKQVWRSGIFDFWKGAIFLSVRKSLAGEGLKMGARRANSIHRSKNRFSGTPPVQKHRYSLGLPHGAVPKFTLYWKSRAKFCDRITAFRATSAALFPNDHLLTT